MNSGQLLRPTFPDPLFFWFIWFLSTLSPAGRLQNYNYISVQYKYHIFVSQIILLKPKYKLEFSSGYSKDEVRMSVCLTD